MSPLRTIFLAAAAGFAAGLPGAALADGVTVHIDQATPMSVGGQISQVVVGNPSIADVSLTDRRHIMILGRSYGLTNIIALDGMGRRIFETTVNVQPAASGRVSLFRGTDLHNYACNDRCERTPMPGENGPTYQNFATPYSDYAGRAKGAAAGGNP